MTLLAFLGFGVFLNSRFQELARIENTNRLLERRIADQWEKTVEERKIAARSAELRKDRFQLRRLVAVLIGARAQHQTVAPEELSGHLAKLSAMPEDEMIAVVNELYAAAFPDEVRVSVEGMIAAALVTRCADGANHEILIHRFLTGCLAPPAPEVTQPLLDEISDIGLRAQATHHLTTAAR